MKRVIALRLQNQKGPFIEWIQSLDNKSKATIWAYIDRLAANGSRKNVKALGDGVMELKIKYGPGLRVYFGEQGHELIVLLIGGDKGSQRSDISKAKNYWRKYVSKQFL